MLAGVGRQKTTYQPISSYNIIENSQTSLAINSVLIGPNSFKFGTKTLTLFSLVQIVSNLIGRHVGLSYRSCQNLEQINHNLHNHVFDDVICKPLIQTAVLQ